MDTQRRAYHEQKAKNETLMRRIKALEEQIDQKRSAIDEKQAQLISLQQLQQVWLQKEQKYSAYDIVFRQLLQETSQHKHEPKPSIQHRQQRREITEQLVSPAALLCHKIERLWSDSKEHPASSNTNDMMLKKCQDLQYDIRQLMEKQSSKDYLAGIQEVTKQECKRQQQLLSDITSQPKAATNDTDKEADTSSTDQIERLEDIKQQQRERLHQIVILETEMKKHKEHVQELEAQLKEKTRANYSDTQVQEAFEACVLAKADLAQESSRLAYLEQYVDEINKVSSVLKAKYGGFSDQPEKETIDAVKRVLRQRSRIISIRQLNRRATETITSQRQRILQIMENIQRLHHELKERTHANVDTTVLNGSIPTVKRSREGTIHEIGRALNLPYTPAPTKIISCLKFLLLRYRLLSSEQHPNISHELEALSLSWSQELQERGIITSEEESEQDAIDTVIHSVNALKDHADNDWKEHVDQQQKQIKANLDDIDDRRKEIEDIQRILEERKLIIKGILGNDYTIQGRNLEEWFQLLDEM